MMKKLLWQLVRDESGQDLIEYALLAAIIALAATAALLFLGPEVKSVYSTVYSKLHDAKLSAEAQQ
jgi:pilus assembly protein Flp/PilA